MRSSEAYKMTLKASFAAFPTRSHPGSGLALLMRTASWVTIIISTTHLLSTCGLQVCEVSLKQFTFWLMMFSSAWSMHILWRLRCWMVHLKSHSQLGIAEKASTLLTNWKSTSSSPLKTFTLATQFSGGWANVVNFYASFSWHMTSFAFLVCIFTILIHNSDLTCLCHRFCSCCRKNLLRRMEHHLPPT